MAQSNLVLLDIENHVALITVNDPDRRNAVTAEMSGRLREAVERVEADSDVHAVVITGAGKAFCAGADLSALGAAGRARPRRGCSSFTTASWRSEVAGCPPSPRSTARPSARA